GAAPGAGTRAARSHQGPARSPAQSDPLLAPGAHHRADHGGDRLGRLAEVVRVCYAVEGELLQHSDAETVRCGLQSGDLVQHLLAVASLIDHPLNPSRLPLDP